MNPRTNVHSPRVPIRTRGRGSDHTYRNPAPSSLSHAVDRCCGSGGGAWLWTLDSNTAPTPSSTASAAYTSPTPGTPNAVPSAKKAVASSGPSRTQLLSIRPAAVYAVVSSVGSRASQGSRAPCVGRTSVRSQPTEQAAA
jgi:hypothetical protein